MAESILSELHRQGEIAQQLQALTESNAKTSEHHDMLLIYCCFQRSRMVGI